MFEGRNGRSFNMYWRHHVKKLKKVIVNILKIVLIIIVALGNIA